MSREDLVQTTRAVTKSSGAMVEVTDTGGNLMVIEDAAEDVDVAEDVAEDVADFQYKYEDENGNMVLSPYVHPGRPYNWDGSLLYKKI